MDADRLHQALVAAQETGMHCIHHITTIWMKHSVACHTNQRDATIQFFYGEPCMVAEIQGAEPEFSGWSKNAVCAMVIRVDSFSPDMCRCSFSA